MKLRFDIPMIKIELDEPLRNAEGEETHGTKLDFLVMEGKKTEQEVWERQEDARRILQEIKAVCEPRDFRVLYAYFVEGKVMADIGKEYQIGRERVRQLIRTVRQRLVLRGMLKEVPEGNKGLRGIAG